MVIADLLVRVEVVLVLFGCIFLVELLDSNGEVLLNSSLGVVVPASDTDMANLCFDLCDLARQLTVPRCEFLDLDSVLCNLPSSTLLALPQLFELGLDVVFDAFCPWC